MPLRADAGLWWNMAGAVACYQPVRAPGPLLARYNMAHGGDNRYRATAGVAPTFDAGTGWTFAAASTQWLTTGVTAASRYTMVVRFSDGVGSEFHCIAGSSGWKEARFFIHNYHATFLGALWGGGGLYSYGSNIAAGVVALANRACYLDGSSVGTTDAEWSGTGYAVYIGARNSSGTPGEYFSGAVQAFAIYARTLSAAEVWTVSRQMAYCDVNPDWSVWGRRRQWFYGPQVSSGFQAAWAAHNNTQIGTGVN